jgi:hypothetical protein
MRKIIFQIVCVVYLLLVLAASGCVAPPTENKSATSGKTGVKNSAGHGASGNTSENPGILAEATQFQVDTTSALGYHEIVAATPLPDDIVCLVEFAKFNATFRANNTAKRFDLKNPPMYISYNITKPFNVTGTRQRKIEGKLVNETYQYYNPYSYLEFTIRNPINGEIYNQDGFSTKYGTNLNKTIQISKTGDLLIEVNANNLTPFIGYWIKPSGNFENTSIDFTTMKCLPQANVKKLNNY